MGNYTEYKEPTKKTGRFGFLCFFAEKSYNIKGISLLNSNHSTESKQSIAGRNYLKPANSPTNGTQTRTSVETSETTVDVQTKL